MPDERNYEIPDDTRVLVVTPNYTNWVTAETHINHVECVSLWKKWGLKTNWMIIGRTFVQFARSQGVQAMLDGGFTHLFFVDDDAIIDPHLLPKYVQHDKHIMITPYPMRKSPFQIGILSSVSYYCRDCRHRWECPGDVTPPPALPCPECSKTTPRDYHEHAMYRNFTTKDLDQGLVQVDGGGTHAMLIKREVFTKSYGFPKPRRGEQLSDDNRSYPEKALDVIHEFQDMSDDPKKRQLFDHYLGDVPDQSMSFEEEWKIDQKPFFVMPKVGTEDMLFSYRSKMKGFEVWCDTDEFAAHIGFAPVITREFTESMEKMGTQPPQKEGAIGLALIGDHARNHNVMYRDAETTLA